MFYGLDLHKRFIQVCRIDGDGRARHDFQIETTREAITAFAQTLGPDDAVVLEATFHTWAVWALLVPHAGRVVVANPLQVRAIAHARVKTDKVDAHILAQLLRLDFIPAVTMPETETWQLRQLVTHQQLLSRKRTAIRNAIHGSCIASCSAVPTPNRSASPGASGSWRRPTRRPNGSCSRTTSRSSTRSIADWPSSTRNCGRRLPGISRLASC